MHHSSFHKNKTSVSKIRYEVFCTSVILNESEGRISYSKDALMINDWLKLVVNGTDSDLAKSKRAFEIATIGNTRGSFLSHEPLHVKFFFLLIPLSHHP